MKNILYLLLFCLITTIAFGQTEDQRKAIELGKKAIQIMDEGQYEESISMLQEAQQLDPKRFDYPYEIAYALYVQEKYVEAAEQLEKLHDYEHVTAHLYQLLGNCYDNTDQPEKALETYKKGLQKFPNEGKLYCEQGILEYARENYNEAIGYWEKGVEIDPYFPSNYYWLGKIFSYTDERIWSVLYGELFMSLEPNTKRTEEMSEILFNTYDDAITISGDGSSGGISFSKNIMINTDKKIKVPFTMDYEVLMSMSTIGMMMSTDTVKTIASLSNTRTTFIEQWYDQKKHKDHDNVIFSFQKKVLDAGHIEAYNYWLLMMGRLEEFETWYNANEDAFNAFVDWFNANRIEFSKKEYFSRLNY